MNDASPDRSRPGRAPILWIAALAVLAAIFLYRSEPPLAEAAGSKVDIVYISVSGEGPNAKAWYDGAPSTGVPVQDALNKFGDQGYGVTAVTRDFRSSVDDIAFVILLERRR